MQNFGFYESVFYYWVILLGNFLSLFHAKFQFFPRLGGFSSNKIHFFSWKNSVFEGLDAFFGTFFGTFLSFFLFNPGRALTRDAKVVSGKPEGTSRCGYESLSLFSKRRVVDSRALTRGAKAVSGKPEGTSPCGCEKKKWSEWVSEWSLFGSLKILDLLYVIGGVLT